MSAAVEAQKVEHKDSGVMVERIVPELVAETHLLIPFEVVGIVEVAKVGEHCTGNVVVA